MDRHGRPIGTFDPLLRDLVGWGLVLRSGPDGGPWRLADEAQQRLNELVEEKAPVDAQSVVYFNRRCSVCGGRGPTWLREERYFCGPCLDRRAAQIGSADEAPTDAVRAKKHMLLHWSRDKGSLAS